MKIHEWIHAATIQLAGVGIGTAKLDAELILAHTIRKGRTWLHAYRDETLTDRQIEITNARLALRADRVPLAYITGHKEFYGRRFIVTPSVLIPRPESEVIIEILSEIISEEGHSATQAKRLVDVGTGSGCLGITAKLEHPNLDVTLLDIDRHALTIAQKNATALNAAVHTTKSDLLSGYPVQTDIILANLPYVDETWERSPETNHEPALALFAKQEGLQLIYRLIDQAVDSLAHGGSILFEADPEQHASLVQYATSKGFLHSQTRDYCVVITKS